MKFGKSLSNQIEETLPEWRDKFLSYKDLKKRLKLIGASSTTDRLTKRPRLDKLKDTKTIDATSAGNVGSGGGGSDTVSSSPTTMTQEEEDFLKLLEAELEKFNTFFVEKEEEYIIRQRELQDRVAMSTGQESEEFLKVRKEIVDFHGEMVLLENYSALNYTGLVKILKKYEKTTGALIRLPFIQKVLQQPFFTTDLLYKLVKECEVMLDFLFPKKNKPSISGENDGGCGNGVVGEFVQKPSKTGLSLANFAVPELEEIEHMESLYMKSTIAALRVLKEIRSGSSTTNVFSLPPLQISGVDERWKNVSLLEQAAK